MVMMMMMKGVIGVQAVKQKVGSVAVIGSGFSGLTAALELRSLGYNVTVYEKNGFVGGRAHQFTNDKGFTFDFGPSWYWMPEIFEGIFAKYASKTTAVEMERYQLTKLDPAYRVFLPEGDVVDVPGEYPAFVEFLAKRDPQSAMTVRVAMEEARRKYEPGMREWVWKPMVSMVEFLDIELIRAALSFDMFGSFTTHLCKYVTDHIVLTVLKWPVIFIGANPSVAPAMYSLMTYAGHALGTFYPNNGQGMAAPAQALARLARENGVVFRMETPVTSLRFEATEKAGMRITHVCTEKSDCEVVNGVVAAADYYHVERTLLPSEVREHDEKYWSKQVLSPSCLLFYLSFNATIPGLLHHSFFFDSDLDAHLHATFTANEHSPTPTFYVSATSKTDKSVLPPSGKGEAVFVLIPFSYRLNGTDDGKEFRKMYLDKVLARMESVVRFPMARHLVAVEDVGTEEFTEIFNSFRGNAFGHANTLTQSLIFKPLMENRKVPNLVFAGHLTNPGPGVPPSLISGMVAAQLLDKKLSSSGSGVLMTMVEVGTKAVYYGFLMLVWVIAGFMVIVALPSQRVRSYCLCVKLMFQHGRTYFAAASLMDPVAFLDTAAMYGLFRIADDFVDCLDGADTRSKNLEQFIAHFYECLESGKGEYHLHPALPAIIETSIRRKYPRRLFEVFFRSMRADAVKFLTIKNMKELEEYMDGSAAVIGEFMLPILNPKATEDEIAKAMLHARDLGNAFQVTNMLRDINEDIDIGRVYMPQDVMRKHGVDVLQRQASQPGFRKFMDEMFEYADGAYASADVGIELLPGNVRDVIRVARLAYHQIHTKIKSELDYDVFAGRAKVGFMEKLRILVKNVPVAKLAWISVFELVVRAVYILTRRPIIAMLMGVYYTMEMVKYPGQEECTYLNYHFLFTLPILAALCANAVMSYEWRHVVRTFQVTMLMCLVATIYTTPWDNYLVYRHVWGYENDGRVIGVLGYVPYEEYAYFSIQTMLSGAMWIACFPKVTSMDLPKRANFNTSSSYKTFGLCVLTAVFAMGVRFVIIGGELTYAGLILSWAMPVLMLQWFIGGQILLHFWSETTMCIFTLSLYLAVTDQWAISNGIWEIQQQYSLPQLIPNLPFEEAGFFFIASTMAVWGITLAMVCLRYNDVTPDAGGIINSLFAVYEWGRPVPSTVGTAAADDLFYFTGLASVVCVKAAGFVPVLGENLLGSMAVFFVMVSISRPSLSLLRSSWYFVLASTSWLAAAFYHPRPLINDIILPFLSILPGCSEGGECTLSHQHNNEALIFDILVVLRLGYWLHLVATLAFIATRAKSMHIASDFIEVASLFFMAYLFASYELAEALVILSLQCLFIFLFHKLAVNVAIRNDFNLSYSSKMKVL
eukprot:c5976_g1_i1.p1 GENE.c5976_g1_i1~~c5976_g1_i1.p1  ORF type:complete len:1376 (-),score=181.31 c5976_g1_i1:17-4144(-)